MYIYNFTYFTKLITCGGPRVVVSTAAFHARVRGSVPGLGGFKETKTFLPHPRVKVSIVGSLRDREVACSASDRQGSNFESCVWRTVSSQSSHHPQEVLLAKFIPFMCTKVALTKTPFISFHVEILHLVCGSRTRFVIPRIKTKTGSRAFSISGPALWNALPVPIRNAKTILTFRKLLKSHLFDLAFPPQSLSSPAPC